MNTISASLKGIDPNDVDVVEINGAKFTIGVVPASIWERLVTENQVEYRDAYRRAIQKLAAAGVDPSALKFPEDKLSKLTEADFATASDVDYATRTHILHLQALKFGLRGFEGFVNRKGDPFTFATVVEQHHGDAMPVMTAEALNVFKYNAALTRSLYVRLRELNELGADGKKA